MAFIDITRGQDPPEDFTEAPAARTLLDVFAQTAARHGDRVAIDADDQILTYRELDRAADRVAAVLREAGVGPGERVGVRLASGTADLYVGILGVLRSGAAYVPVDVDDPPARARTIFEQARVCGVLEDGLQLRRLCTPVGRDGRCTIEDEAWVIFTSGSTGQPKGVAISHRSAAAFVDAEARLWRVGPEDRVLAGLSVGFDASCEEIWLAWGNGAALVPASRELVRSGVDLGPWLKRRRITVVSTVPTLAAMWQERALAGVRLMILGGEACPAELGWRLAEGREVWNTYGPTEATVVATAARIRPGRPLTIGWPLAGWQVAVVGRDGAPVAFGEAGELVIGGVGLGRYLDEELDAERYAALEALGWARAYRSGDIVRETVDGIEFVGRGDHQVKLGGRRLELGEVEAQLMAVAGVRAAAAAVQTTAAANRVLVGYVVGDVDPVGVRDQIAARLPVGLAPVVVVLERLPISGSGKLDRGALPWPPPQAAAAAAKEGTDTSTGTGDRPLSATEGWLADRWIDQLGPVAIDRETDFFVAGGSSMAAAKLVSVVRERFPSVAVADVYQHRSLAELAARLEHLGERSGPTLDAIAIPGRRLGSMQLAGVAVLTGLVAIQWVIVALGYGNIESDGLPHVGWGWLILAWLTLSSPIGRVTIAMVARRALLWRLTPGRYPRDSWLACRVWFLERLGELCRLERLAGTPWAGRYARLIGAQVGPGARLASMPGLASLVRIGAGATVAGRVDLHGWWIDGPELVIGEISVGAGASVGGRTLLSGGATIGEGAEIEPGSVICGTVPPGERWGGSPARRLGQAGVGWPVGPPATGRHPRLWRSAFAISLLGEGLIALVALAPAVAVLVAIGVPAPAWSWSLAVIAGEVALFVALSTVTLAVVVAVTLRLVWRLVRPGWHGGDGAVAWALWFSGDLTESISTTLFPLYASLYTRRWLTMMGIRIGRGTEISTSTGLNRLVSFGELSHATDDVGFCGARARGGWLHIEEIEVGSRSFLGPGAVLREGTRIGDDSLVGALTLAPRQAPDGTSWFGVPALELPRAPAASDPARTTAPPRRLILARGTMDAIRILLPNTISLIVGLCGLVGLDAIGARLGIVAMVLACPLVVLACGLVCAAIAVILKWAVIGRYRSGEHPLWSFFVWRDELINSAHEQLAGEWLLRLAIGTPLMSLYLRAMGARVGRGVWCETTAITEYDVVTLRDGCVVNRDGCLMTHVFQDRLLRIGPTTIGVGATMGPTSAVLPDTRIGDGACIGGHSVVLRGEELPDGTRWHGAPVMSA